MAAKFQDKILFGVALVLLLTSFGWALLQTSKLSALRAAPQTIAAPFAYVPAGIDAPKVSTETWPQPIAQTRGAEWIYDVFTPPEIYYDATTRQFSVTPPKEKEVVVVEPPPFGVELVRVKPDDFRLQLVGYVGGQGDYRGTFQNTLTGEIIIGKAGKTFPTLGLTIKTFEVNRNVVKSKDSMDTIEYEATAAVVDTKTGDEVMLTNKHRRIAGTPIAIIKISATSELVEHKTGGTFTAGNATYTVGNITLEPPSVVITKQSVELATPDTQTLIPPDPAKAVPPQVAPTEPAPAASQGSPTFGS